MSTNEEKTLRELLTWPTPERNLAFEEKTRPLELGAEELKTVAKVIAYVNEIIKPYKDLGENNRWTHYRPILTGLVVSGGKTWRLSTEGVLAAYVKEKAND